MPPVKSPTPDILDEAKLLGPLDAPVLKLRFCGPFEGRTVTWDATFCALSACEDNPPPRQNFIEIGKEGEQGLLLTVGLNVQTIDAPTVRKTLTMIRQYKRLSRGRHTFGPMRDGTSD